MFLRNILIVLGIVFVLAGLGLTVTWFGRGDSSNDGAIRTVKAQMSEQIKPAMLIAKRPLPAGTLLRDSDMAWKEIAPGKVGPGVFLRGRTSKEDLLGAITQRDFAEGDALRVKALVMPNDRQFLAAVLKPGRRAVSISVNAPQSSSGLVLPGDYVDVILTQNFAVGDGGVPQRTVAETVLRKVRIIAVDRNLNKPSTVKDTVENVTDVPDVPKTITLELTERQAQALFVATQLGSIQLSVHPLAASAETLTDDGESTPTWATDVSPAFKQLAGSSSGSALESLIRRPPAAHQQ